MVTDLPVEPKGMTILIEYIAFLLAEICTNWPLQKHPYHCHKENGQYPFFPPDIEKQFNTPSKPRNIPLDI